MKTVLALALMTLSSSAFAQTTAPTTTQPAEPTTTQPAPAPTQAQCSAGWKDGMPWTQSDFTLACAKFKGTN